MTTASKRAEAATSTLAISARQGASMSNHSMEMTMETDITAPDGGATVHTLQLSESRQRPLNSGEPIKFDVTLDGQPVVIRSTTPMLDTCRVLLAWGYAGKAKFIREDGVEAMTWDIAAGARLTVEEDTSGPRFRKLRTLDPGEVATGGRDTPNLIIGSVEA